MSFSANIMRLCQCLLFMGFLATPAYAQSGCDDVSGAWSVELDLPGTGASEVQLTLEQSGCELTGFIEGRNKTPIDNGVVEGSTGSFSATAINQAGGQPVVIAWEITVDGDDIVGSFSSAMIPARDFVGTRVEP